MADPISVAGLVLAVGDVLSRLYGYVMAVKESKNDIRRLTQEILALKGTLEHLSENYLVYQPEESELPDDKALQYNTMLQMTSETVEIIRKQLGEPKSRLEKVARALKWPFTQPEMDKYIASIERAKTWFLMIIMNDTAELTSKVYSEMTLLAATIHEDIIDRRTDRMLKESEEILSWLAPVGSKEEHSRFCRTRAPGTGEWFFDESFEEWLQDCKEPKSIMWVTGKSGAGKTILFSRVVDKLQDRCRKSNGEGYGFHYCSLDNAASQQPANVFGSILAQSTIFKPDIIDVIRPLRQSSNSLITQNTLTVAEFNEVLQKTLSLFNRFYILVDALNETPHQAAIISTLLGLCHGFPGLRVFVTCTSKPVSNMGTYSDFFLREMGSGNNHDIKEYVRHRIHSEACFSSLSESTQHEIEYSIVSGASGMFRWAQLCMDHLGTLRTGREIKNALGTMPSTLNETYAGLLQRIPIADREIAREALMWLSFCLRPLLPVELSEAVVLQESDCNLDNDCRLKSPEVISDICHGLLNVDRDGVSLAHDSIRSFLTSDWIRDSQVAFFALERDLCNRKIMRKCISYLRFDEFAVGPTENPALVYPRLQSYPLLDYAAQYWPVHAESFTLDQADEDFILSFFATKRQRNGGSFDSWVQALIRPTSPISIARTEPLYYAASYNMVSILKILLKPGSTVNVDQLGGRLGSTPLFIACWRRNINAAKLLLEAGADPDWFDRSTKETCRSLAHWKGLEEVLELMDKLQVSQ